MITIATATAVAAVIAEIAQEIATSYGEDGGLTNKESACISNYFDNKMHAADFIWSWGLDGKRWLFGDKTRDGLEWHGAAGGETVELLTKAMNKCGVSKEATYKMSIAIFDKFDNEWSKVWYKKELKLMQKKAAKLYLDDVDDDGKTVKKKDNTTLLLVGGLALILLLRSRK